jgi:hypothetical protein
MIPMGMSRTRLAHGIWEALTDAIVRTEDYQDCDDVPEAQEQTEKNEVQLLLLSLELQRGSG